MRTCAHAGVFWACWSTGGGLEIGGARDLLIRAADLADFFEVVRLVIAGKHAENVTYLLERTATAGLRLYLQPHLVDEEGELDELDEDPWGGLDDVASTKLLSVSTLDVSDFLEVVTLMMPPYPATTPKEPSP